MEPDEYALMAQVEMHHWWYRGLRGRVMAELDGHIGRDAVILDAGCGTGGTIAVLSGRFPAAKIIGIDLSRFAIVYGRQKAAGHIAYGNVNTLPFGDDSFDAITGLDVIYHADVDENKALREFRRVLKPDGVLVINVPAFEWMRSNHDVVVHTARRYTAGLLRRKLVETGFQIVSCGYRNSLLFPIMAAQRLAEKAMRSSTPRSAVRRHSAPTNALLRAVMGLENVLFGLGIRFPWGGSVFAVLTKPAS